MKIKKSNPNINEMRENIYNSIQILIENKYVWNNTKENEDDLELIELLLSIYFEPYYETIETDKKFISFIENINKENDIDCKIIDIYI